ncbi:eukaryotic translation elongation factor 1 epsilon-1-like [Rousettus aegyptiacus]|uniref:eukaryotic translation elongation factor 1 epsilon-1-like n=1 Tax=Rousettus aegyptiacus TaxID=9407 RepID=UPI00168CFC86|nr:eukaryotic translation elongation factor 1 epsilon-1-like [Rousettus aegyptiacus]
MVVAVATVELTLLEKSLGLSKGNKYSIRGEYQVPVLQTKNGPSLTGLTTSAVKQAYTEYLLGSTTEEKVIVQQWLEYRVTQVDGHSNKDDIRILLKNLNSHPEDKVSFTEYKFTSADILLYYELHCFIADLKVQEKEKYLTVSHWFCHVRHYPGIRQHLSSVVFMENRLYTSSH